MSYNIPKQLNPQVISYITLRKTVGILAILFPVIIIVGSVIFGECDEILGNLSTYYHTNMRNLYVGILCAIALFLFAYKGYDRRDAIAGNIACILALLIAFFPTSVTELLTPCISSPYENKISSSIHFFSAGGFFLIMAYFSIFLRLHWWKGIQKYHPIILLETLTLWAFGISWLVKGNTIMIDKKVKSDA